MGRRILNDALRTMVNAERRGKATAQLQPISGVMISFLNIMKHRGISYSVLPLIRLLSAAAAQTPSSLASHLIFCYVQKEPEGFIHDGRGGCWW
ncbi:unnamed protein product [Triticum turgidum subsp. durum]|uniref:30S ribosomal protein S8, chloroplastic n=1 Tax=Triticum turgidum subsp. durum TaxID=4567 RepID=A0A9R0RGE8_TRITD|nr:unnamed protein product [Triticum turgidum subsp. durum]